MNQIRGIRSDIIFNDFVCEELRNKFVLEQQVLRMPNEIRQIISEFLGSDFSLSEKDKELLEIEDIYDEYFDDECECNGFGCAICEDESAFANEFEFDDD